VIVRVVGGRDDVVGRRDVVVGSVVVVVVVVVVLVVVVLVLVVVDVDDGGDACFSPRLDPSATATAPTTSATQVTTRANCRRVMGRGTPRRSACTHSVAAGQGPRTFASTAGRLDAV
jgi:hypothetical protein